MRADGTTCHSSNIPVVTVGLDRTERIDGGPHTVIVSVETTAVTVTREYEYHLTLLGHLELLNDFAEQGKRWKHVHQPPLPVL